MNNLKETLENHKKWLNNKKEGKKANLRWANLRWADLREADLREANLREADLREANLDFTCLSLSCKGLNWKIDRKIAIQILYHFCSMQCEDKEIKSIRNKLINLSNEIHRTDVPKLEKIK